MKIAALAIALSLMSTHTFAAKPCDELKTEIAAKLDAKGVVGYTLDIIASDQAGEQKIVGSCEGGTKKITYVRGAAAASVTPPAAATQ